jgi:hypothetical protein
VVKDALFCWTPIEQIMPKDPWFPLVAMLLVVLLVWLGIAGPLPDDVTGVLKEWQPLIATLVAIGAAYIAFSNTSRSLTHAEKLERHRRGRKQAAVRAMLPLALSQIVAYAEQSTVALVSLSNLCQGNTLPPNTATTDAIKNPPSETLEKLAEFIEYSDSVNVEIVESLVATIQIHGARTRGLVHDNNDPKRISIVTRHEIEGRIIDAASIYAGAASLFDYARRRQHQVTNAISWDDVENALGNMRIWDQDHPDLYKMIDGRKSKSFGPFEALKKDIRQMLRGS